MFNHSAFQRILLKYLYGNGRCPSSGELNLLAESTSRLSRLFTRERGNLPIGYLKDKNLRTAYILYFLQANLYKIHIPLNELSLHPSNLFLKDRLRILDIGSGPGTAILGILDFFAGCDNNKKPFLEFVAVDSVAENLRDAEGLFKLFRKECYLESSLTTIKSSIERIKKLPSGLFDIIVLSNLLSEMCNNDPERIDTRVKVLKRLLNDFMTSNGSCIIIEPALRETSREMLMVRDGLLQEGFHIYSPCLIDKYCPALDNSKDWCHEDISWHPPKLITSIDELTGLRKDSIKFSYLVIRKDTLSLTDIYGNDVFRVVSEPLISKGKVEFYVCGVNGRNLVVRLDRDRSPLNKEFDELRRGDVVLLKGLLCRGNRFSIIKGSEVQRLGYP